MTKPKIQIICESNRAHERKTIQNLLIGFAKHDIVDICFERQPKPGYDLYVTWAWKPQQVDRRWYNIKNITKQYGGRCLVMERAYIGNRNHWVSLGYDGLNGRADFCNKEITDLTRWQNKFSQYLLPQKQNKTGNVLICGQVRTDASLCYLTQNYRSYDDWVLNTIEKCRAYKFNPIYRPHPLDQALPDWRNRRYAPFDIDTNPSIEKTFSNVDLVVTYNSNAGVLGILNGLPVVSHDEGSMVWEVSKHRFDEPRLLDYPNIKSWKAKISYTQWEPYELASGEAWDHLKNGLQLISESDTIKTE